MKILAHLLLAIGLTSAAAGQPTTFSPHAHKHEVGGPPTEVLVLGSAHLSQMPEGIRNLDLEPLLERLATWRPAIVMIEHLPGIDCAFLGEYAEIFGDTAESYCRDSEPARSALGLSAHDAVVAADQLWANWPERPAAGDRRYMAAALLAAGEPASALVQWLRLPAAERRAGDGLTDDLVAELETLSTRRNEGYSVAARLAARLGLERVYPIDNHSAIDPVFDTPEYADAIRRIWSGPGNAVRRQAEGRMLAALTETGDILAYYRSLNAADYPELVYAGDFGAAIADDTEGLPGRHYAAWWEVRNLRVAANIRAVLARHPGARALVIVGASHKGYLDAYLDMMTPLRLADSVAMLGGPED